MDSGNPLYSWRKTSDCSFLAWGWSQAELCCWSLKPMRPCRENCVLISSRKDLAAPWAYRDYLLSPCKKKSWSSVEKAICKLPPINPGNLGQVLGSLVALVEVYVTCPPLFIQQHLCHILLVLVVEILDVDLWSRLIYQLLRNYIHNHGTTNQTAS